jgi:hypothetical protein
MISFMAGATAAWVLTIGIAAAATIPTKTCQRFDAVYRANLDVTADALRQYRQCVTVKTAPDACSTEFSHLLTAQEFLEATFSSYATACGSTVVRSSDGDWTTSGVFARLVGIV